MSDIARLAASPCMRYAVNQPQPCHAQASLRRPRQNTTHDEIHIFCGASRFLAYMISRPPPLTNLPSRFPGRRSPGRFMARPPPLPAVVVLALRAPSRRCSTRPRFPSPCLFGSALLEIRVASLFPLFPDANPTKSLVCKKRRCCAQGIGAVLKHLPLQSEGHLLVAVVTVVSSLTTTNRPPPRWPPRQHCHLLPCHDSLQRSIAASMPTPKALHAASPNPCTLQVDWTPFASSVPSARYWLQDFICHGSHPACVHARRSHSPAPPNTGSIAP